MKLHTEYDVSSRAPELLVVALQLGGKESKAYEGPKDGKPCPMESLDHLSKTGPQGHPKSSEGEVTNTKWDLRALWEKS